MARLLWMVPLLAWACACGGAPFETSADVGPGGRDEAGTGGGELSGPDAAGSDVGLPGMRPESGDDGEADAQAMPGMREADAAATDAGCMTLCLVPGTFGDYAPCPCP